MNNPVAWQCWLRFTSIGSLAGVIYGLIQVLLGERPFLLLLCGVFGAGLGLIVDLARIVVRQVSRPSPR